MIVLLVALAGGAGAAARFAVDSVVAARVASSWPLGTLVVNITGSLLLGVVAGVTLRIGPGPLTAAAGTGFLGGYTTFSTACVEAVRHARAGRGVVALLHATAMALLSVLAAAAGLWLAGP